MFKKIKIVLFTFFLFLSFHIDVVSSQFSPVSIYDLNSITDSSGVDHIFFRIQEVHQNEIYELNNIYRLNTETVEEALFLEDYFDRRFGFEFNVRIAHYTFFENDPEKYLVASVGCDFECFGGIFREDSGEAPLSGYFFSVDYIASDRIDSGNVYASVDSHFIIGKNGGRDWPAKDALDIPDSSRVYFPLTSLSPHNDSLMFGIGNSFFRTIDRGKSSILVSDTLIAQNIVYDANPLIIYFLDTINVPGSGKNCSIDQCSYGLYSVSDIQTGFDWRLLKVFNENVTLVSHPVVTNTFYIWTNDYILESKDGGNSFEEIVSEEESKSITGFTVTKNSVYYSTEADIFKKQGEDFISIKSIQVSNEEEWFESEATSYQLITNYPNPFNPSTTILYKVEKTSDIDITLYSLDGKRIQNLFKGVKTPGEYKINFNASTLSSGVYLLNGKIGDQIINHKLTLIK